MSYAERVSLIRAAVDELERQAADAEREAQDLDAELENCDDDERAATLGLRRLNLSLELARVEAGVRRAEEALTMREPVDETRVLELLRATA